MTKKDDISTTEDLKLADLDAVRTGEATPAPGINRDDRQVLDDLEKISEIFAWAKPDAGEIPESVDQNVLSLIKDKSREIKRSRKVVRIYPGFKWAAAAAMGIIVCLISYTQLHDSHDSPAPEKNMKVLQAEYDKPKKKTLLSENKTIPVYSGSDKSVHESPDDVDGNGRVNIIDAYIMDRRLMSGVSMPKKLDLNGDGKVNSEDINTIVKTSVSLGKGEV